MKKKLLMTPGPSPVPPFVLESLSKEIIHHRTDEFRDILGRVHEKLKKVFCTGNPVMILASSGTGAMEASVSNLLSKGDKVITVSGGKFGQRWFEIAKAYSLDAIEMKVDWGNAPNPEDLQKLLDENSGVKAVFTTLCETSTATAYDIKALGEVTKKNGLLLVADAISGLGQDKLLADEWGVDVVVSGSQKGLMLPPGLSFISLSQKAQNLLKSSDLNKYYFDLSKALASYHKCDTPFTPAVSLIVGLDVALSCIVQEGVQERCLKFEKMAEAARQAAKAIGLGVFSRRPSASVTAISVPENIKSGQLVKILRKDYGLSIAGGQAQLKDKIFRIAHMGWINEKDLEECFRLIEKVLADLGHSFDQGASLARLKEVLNG